MNTRARLFVLSAIPGCAALMLLSGWFVRRTPAAPDALFTCAPGRHPVSVNLERGCAVEVAARTVAELQAAGWIETPVSTATFHLLTRGEAVTALLAEDTPHGVRLTRIVY